MGSTRNLAVTQITEITAIVIKHTTSTLIANQSGTASDQRLATIFQFKYLKFCERNTYFILNALIVELPEIDSVK